jgi:hypothetical protein
VKKRRVTLNLDEDIVEALKGMGAPSISAAANVALREAVDVELHRRALSAWLEEMSDEHGPPSASDYAAARAVLDEALGRPAAGGAHRRGAA